MPAALCARALQDQLVELEAANMSADFERNGDSFKEYFKRWDRHGPDRDGSGRPGAGTPAAHSTLTASCWPSFVRHHESGHVSGAAAALRVVARCSCTSCTSPRRIAAYGVHTYAHTGRAPAPAGARVLTTNYVLGTLPVYSLHVHYLHAVEY